MSFSSEVLNQAVNEIAKLPGIGRKSALRLALYLLKQPQDQTHQLSAALSKLVDEVMYCSTCHNLSDTPQCSICSNPSRRTDLLCVVEDIRDVMAIENTQQFKGKYHVLGGVISPMDGIGPADLHIQDLVSRLASGEITELILALPTTMEGDTTNFYLYKKVQHLPVTITTLARGVAVGDELEYADEVTLGRSILHRLPYENSLRQKE